ncbi:MAG: glycosyltransferase family 4 protein [Gammaproteobacteria bacterium]|nr:glycosyltransferase family 4 protein [Gammaproteobacteria bacterium]
MTTDTLAQAASSHTDRDAGARPRIFTTFGGVRNLLERHAAGDWNGHAVTVFDSAHEQHRILWRYAWSRPGDLFVFNGEANLVSAACVLRRLMPTARGRIVAADMVLRKPEGAVARLKARIRRSLWRRVNLFLHYFRDLRCYESHYGIGPERSRYVAFKANVFSDALKAAEAPQRDDGAYVFSAGRSLRDYQTLLEAAKLTDLPFAILFTSTADWAAHGTFVDIRDLPPNVRLVADDGGKAGWLRGLKEARIVAIPTRPESICASGIGTCLDAMALGKPVVITRGPGADDVLTDGQACFVPPRDAQALASTLEKLWHDDARRREIASRGHRYAMQLGDEEALMARILEASLAASM